MRGSSELHGWGDSNLYLRRKGHLLTISTEHRAAPSQDHIPLELNTCGDALSLSVLDPPSTQPPAQLTPLQKVRQILSQLQQPAPIHYVRKLCGIRMAAVSSALAQLADAGEVTRSSAGYQLNFPLPLSPSIDPQGNGNGKHHSLYSSAG